MTAKHSFLQNLWTRLWLRGVHYRNSHTQIEWLYRLENPWRLDDPKEIFRFERTNELIVEAFGSVGGLLEIGSGEGHQSAYLARVCQRLRGCEISDRAVERARRRVPSADFVVGPFGEATAGTARAYDVAVACEVLYYIEDVEAAVALMSRISRGCLVTYYDRQASRLDPLFAGIANVQRAQIGQGDVAWNVVWWRND